MKHPRPKPSFNLQMHKNRRVVMASRLLVVRQRIDARSRPFARARPSPARVHQGFQLALDVALQHLEHRAETMDADRKRLVSVARTSMTGTSADTGDDTLANLIVEALNTVASSDGVDHEDVRMASEPRAISTTRAR